MPETLEKPPVDNRSDVEKAMTAHLVNVRVPDRSSPAEDEIAALPDVKLPKTLKATHEALNEARQEKDIRVRVHKVTALAAHLHELGRGAKPIEFDQKTRSSLAASQNDAAEEIQIEMLGRQYPVIKKWLGEQKAEIETLKADKKALNSEIETLKNTK